MAVSVVSYLSPLAVLAGREASTIRGDASLADAGALMERNGVSALLVEDPSGIVTERDLARAFAHGLPSDAPVVAAATPHPLSVPPHTTVVDAAALMLNEHVRHLVVVDDGCRAVVSLRDVAAVLLQSATPELWLTSLRVTVDAPAEIWLG